MITQALHSFTLKMKSRLKRKERRKRRRSLPNLFKKKKKRNRLDPQQDNKIETPLAEGLSKKPKRNLKARLELSDWTIIPFLHQLIRSN